VAFFDRGELKGNRFIQVAKWRRILLFSSLLSLIGVIYQQ
jgi:hypothetical protein